MGFGSSAAAMQVVMKNNRKLLRARKHFNKTGLGSYGLDKKTEFNLPMASPQVLRNIKSKMQLEREMFVRKALILGAVFAALALMLLIKLG